MAQDHKGAGVSLTNVVKIRERNDVRFELNIPSFEVHPGAFVAVVGQSGCGKSTLLDMLALVLSPTKADALHYHLDGERTDIWAMAHEKGEADQARIRREHIGYVLQTGGLFGFLSVRDNARLPAQLKGLSDFDTHIEKCADDLGISDMLSKKPQYLSGGQRQRSAILRALSNRPGLILADEPTAAVDQENARLIVEEFRTLARDGHATVIMVTHDTKLVADVADMTYGFRIERISETLTRSHCLRLEDT